MLQTELNLVDIIKKGQSGIYDETAAFIRNFTGEVRTVIEGKNPLNGQILIDKIDKILQIVNPALDKEIAWFKEAKIAIKLWVNDIVIANRILGIKNDNTYDVTVFEKAIMQHFFLSEKPKADAEIKTDFKTMVEMVELGARRFRNS